MSDILVNAIGHTTTSTQGVAEPGFLDAPQSASEFIAMILKLKVPIIDRDELSVQEYLGSGASMTVDKAEWKGQLVAMKTLIVDGRLAQKEKPVVLASFLREARFYTFSRIRKHPNIIRLLGMSWDVEMALQSYGAAHALNPIAVLELADDTLGGYVEKNRGAIPITTKAALFADIVNGLDALHSEGLIHSDMTPANILIKMAERSGRPVAKLGDFGESIQIYYPDPKNLGYSEKWKSPEMHRISASSSSEEPQSSNHASQSRVIDALNPGQELCSAMSTLDLQPDTQTVVQDVINNHAPEDIPPLPPLTGCLALEQWKARDIFSTGLVLMYLLIEHLPFEDPRNHVEVRGEKETLREHWSEMNWLTWKRGYQEEAASWIRDHHSLFFQDADLQNGICPDLDLDQLFGYIPEHMLPADPGKRMTSRQLAEKLDCVSGPMERRNLASSTQLVENRYLQGELRFCDVPSHMREPLWQSLVEEALLPSGSVNLRHFIGLCYIEGDGVDMDVEEGLHWLLKGATNETSSELILTEIRESCMREYVLADKRISQDVSPATVKEWVLDGVFLLGAGYWYCFDEPVHQLKLKLARKSFSDALECLDEGEIDRIVGLGFTVYMAGTPSEQESKLRKMNGLGLQIDADNCTGLVRIAVFSVDSGLIERLRADNTVPLNLFWDLRLVRGLAHYGYDDSLRLLHGIDLENRTTAQMHGEFIGSELLDSINNNETMESGSKHNPERLLPPIHGAVAKRRLACLAQILRLDLTIGDQIIIKVDLDMPFIVDPLYGPETPLPLAVRTLQPYLVCLLLSYGADPNWKHPWTGNSVLHTICHINVEEEDVREWAWGCYTAQDRPTYLQKIEDMKLAQRVILQLLLNCENIDLQAQDRNGHTPLRVCVSRNAMFIPVLMERGCRLSEEETEESSSVETRAMEGSDDTDFEEQPEMIFSNREDTKNASRLHQIWERVSWHALKSLLEAIGRLVAFGETPLKHGMKRVRWKCTCGIWLYDDFIELQTGALQELEKELNDPNTLFTEKSNTITSKIWASTLSFLGFTRHSYRDKNYRVQQPSERRPPTNERLELGIVEMDNPINNDRTLFLLMCIDSGHWKTKLMQKDLYDISSDRELFSVLRDVWNKRRKSKWYSLPFRGLRDINFVRFSVDMESLADIGQCSKDCFKNDCGCRIPPEPMMKGTNPEYSYDIPTKMPPIGSTYLKHWLQDPHGVPAERKSTRNQLPKKFGQLRLSPSSMATGWGIHFQEGFCWRSRGVFTMMLPIPASLLFGVFYSTLNKDVQGGFGVATYIFGVSMWLLTWVALAVQNE